MDNKNKPMGLAIGLICNGKVPIKWMFHQKEQVEPFLPGGLYWSYIFATGDFTREPEKNYASLRNDVVNKALDGNYKYLLFIDDDVFLPQDGVNQLFKAMKDENADIVSGIYYMKNDVPQPVIYETVGDGPIWDIKPDTNFEIGGSGLGCSLIKMDVFRTMKAKGIPFFKQGWVHENPITKKKIQVKIGEDHWLYKSAKDLGFKIIGTSKVLCDHYDVNKDKFYPDPKYIQSIKDKAHQFEITIDDEKPTIILWNRNGVPINAESVDKKPLGGSETALIEMAHELSYDNNVIVLCNCDKEGLQNGVSYFNNTKINSIIKYLENTTNGIELFVSSRDCTPFVGGRPPAKQTALWFHDMPQNGSLSIDNLENIDKLLFVSDFQRKSYREFYKKDLLFDKREEFDSKSVITSNGVIPRHFENKLDLPIKKGKCIYASTPYRGLDILLNCWVEIKKQVPWAELHLFTSMGIYNQNETPETAKLLEIAKKMQKYDVYVIGSVDKIRLAEEICTSEMMLYPTHFLETFCIAVADTLYANRSVITSNLGALNDFIGKGKIRLIDGDVYSDEYIKEFIEETVFALTQQKDDMFDISSTIPTWEDVANQWRDVFFKKTKVNKDKKPNDSIEPKNTDRFFSDILKNEMDSTL